MRHDRHFVESLVDREVAPGELGILLPVSAIETNREQPRANLGDLSELAQSIRTRGVLEPLLVRALPEAGKYQLIAGERRFHASVEAGLTHVPCIEMHLSDQEALEVALIENLQRKDLTPFEEAEGYQTLVRRYAYTHEDVARAVGKSRTTVTESLRLLSVPPAIRDLCRHADITAKSILLLIARADSIEEMERLVQEIAEGNLDRDAARLALRQPIPADLDGPSDQTPQRPDGSSPASVPQEAGRFRPLQLRYRTAPDAPVHLSLSIRRPGVTRAQLVATLEDMLAKLRAGDLDDRLADVLSGAPAEPGPE
jgi:ParB family chromosome partitioning protein